MGEAFDDLPPPRLSTSLTELVHLAGSIGILSVIFAFLILDRAPDFLRLDPASRFSWTAFGDVFPATVLIVVLAFMVHELAHKVVAQRYYFWAEYRAQWGTLGGALGINFLLPWPIPFVVPGFVQIIGDATYEENGKISAVGPAMNLLIGYVALLAMQADLFSEVILGKQGTITQWLVLVNGLLATFNLIPVSVLDGAKVARWNVGVYAALLIASIVLLLAGFQVGPF